MKHLININEERNKINDEKYEWDSIDKKFKKLIIFLDIELVRIRFILEKTYQIRMKLSERQWEEGEFSSSTNLVEDNFV
jgi:hypothetical protein